MVKNKRDAEKTLTKVLIGAEKAFEDFVWNSGTACIRAHKVKLFRSSKKLIERCCSASPLFLSAFQRPPYRRTRDA
jgi:hypothetical protein